MRHKKEIIKKDQLLAVKQCICFLKEHCTYRGLFINFGSRVLVNKIITKIRKGDENLLEFLRNYCTPRECATALNHYLRKIGKPLLPKRVQELILGDNDSICPRIIALDALSLLWDELEGPHRDLFFALMDMMKTLSTVGSLKPTELRVSHAPYLLMPLLFTPTKDSREKITRNWKKMADILNEMIICYNSSIETGRFQVNDQIPANMITFPPASLIIPPARRRSHPILNDIPFGRPRISSLNRLNPIAEYYFSLN